MGVEIPVLLALLVVAFLAGFVDAVAGGGGLLQVPALLAALGPSGLAFAQGTNKVAAVCGTAAALRRYDRNGSVRWARVAVVGPIAFAGSAAGSWGLLEVLKHAAHVVRPAFAVCFVALSVQQIWKTFRYAGEPAPRPARPWIGIAFVAAIGLYDGFVGPGTGMFLFWALSTWFALPALEATGTTKAVNVITNLGALAVFVARGLVLWPLALTMAAANLLGGVVGAHTAIRRGVRFIRLTTAVVSIGASIYLLVS
jgi:uncharacterized membrane protein YfcA